MIKQWLSSINCADHLDKHEWHVISLLTLHWQKEKWAMHSLGCRKGRAGAWLCCPQSHQALTGSGVRTHELMAVMVSPERGPTHLPSPSAEITSWDIPWQPLGCASPDSGSAPAATRCSSKHSLCASAQLAAPGLGVCGHCQAACSHTKLALPEGSLPAREMGAVALGRHCAPGVTHPCRQCWQFQAVSLQVSPISSALPVPVQQLLQPLLVQYAADISHL